MSGHNRPLSIVHRRWAVCVVVVLAVLAAQVAFAGSVHVNGYTRRDGTYVAPHTRSSPGSGHSLSSGGSSSHYSIGGHSGTGGSPYTGGSLGKLRGGSGGILGSLLGGSGGGAPLPKSALRAEPGYGAPKRDAKGRIERSSGAKSAFKRNNPCPSTGKTNGACNGWVIDHVTPLKRGGADAPSNMQWQTTEDAKAKDKWE